MKVSALSFAIFCFCVSVHAEPKKILLFATFLENTPVQLADGARWMMDKGDSFPVLMFKDQQTKVVLKLAGTSFPTEIKSVRVVDESQMTDEMLASYRRNVVSYLDGKARKWRDQAKAQAEPEPPASTPGLFDPATVPH